MSNYDPSLMAFLDEEQDAIRKSSTKANRLKMEEGSSYVVRYLPAKLGPNGLFFARIAQHWIAKHPRFCVRHTHPDFGGDPQAECQMCSLAEELNEDGNRNVSSLGYRSMANNQWLMYCLLFEQDDGKGEKIITGPDRWQPMEFWHNKTGFNQFVTTFKRYIKPNNPDSVLDCWAGNDFLVQMGQRGNYTLQREDAAPMFDAEMDEAAQDQLLEQVFSGVKMPTYRELSEEAQQEAVDKLNELAEFALKQPEKEAKSSTRTAAASPTVSRRSAAPTRHAPASAPVTRRAATTADVVPTRSAPVSRGASALPSRASSPPSSRASSPPPSRAAAAPPTRAPQPVAPEPEIDEAPPGPEDDIDYGPSEATTDEPHDHPTDDNAGQEEVAEEPAMAQEPPRAPTASALSQRVRKATLPQRAAPTSSSASTIDHDEDNVTDEKSDPAPPATDTVEDLPPVKSPTSTAAQPARLSDRLRRGISSAVNR